MINFLWNETIRSHTQFLYRSAINSYDILAMPLVLAKVYTIILGHKGILKKQYKDKAVSFKIKIDDIKAKIRELKKQERQAGNPAERIALAAKSRLFEKRRMGSIKKSSSLKRLWRMKLPTILYWHSRRRRAMWQLKNFSLSTSV